MKILSSSEKKKIINKLNEQFGISDIPFRMLQFGKEKIRVFSGNLPSEKIMAIEKNLRVENAGLYIVRIVKDGIRLTIDGTHFFKNNITKGILRIEDTQTEIWMKGEDLDINTDKRYAILKNNNDFLGCGKSTGEKIINTIPRERRVNLKI